MTSLNISEECHFCTITVNLAQNDFIRDRRHFLEKKVNELFLDKLIDDNVCINILEVKETHRSIVDDDLLMNVSVKFRYKSANFNVDNIICNFRQNTNFDSGIGLSAFSNITAREEDDDIYIYLMGIDRYNKKATAVYKEWHFVLKKLQEINAADKLYGVVKNSKKIGLDLVSMTISPLTITPLYIYIKDETQINMKDLIEMANTDEDYLSTKKEISENKIKTILLNIVIGELNKYMALASKDVSQKDHYYYVDILSVYNVNKDSLPNTSIPLMINSKDAPKIIMDYRRMLNEFILRIFADFENRAVEVLNVYLNN